MSAESTRVFMEKMATTYHPDVILALDTAFDSSDASLLISDEDEDPAIKASWFPIFTKKDGAYTAARATDTAGGVVPTIGTSVMSENHLAFRIFEFSSDIIWLEAGDEAELAFELYAMQSDQFLDYEAEKLPEGIKERFVESNNDEKPYEGFPESPDLDKDDFILQSNAKESEDDIKRRLFIERVLPRIRNYFDKEIDWEKLPDDDDSNGNGPKFKARRNISPTILAHMRSFVHGDDHIDTMFDNIGSAMGEVYWTSQSSGFKITDISTAALYAHKAGDKNYLGIESYAPPKFKKFFNRLLEPDMERLISADGDEYTNIIFDLGFLEVAKEIAEDVGIDMSDVTDAYQYAAAVAGNALGLLGEIMINNAFADVENATKELSMDRLQCALFSELVYGDKGWDRYWTIENDKKPISPLAPKAAGTNRILPVKGNIEPNSFMNRAIIGSKSKDTFEKASESKDIGNTMFKELWWVYSTRNKAGIPNAARERRLFLSSAKAKELGKKQTSKAIRSLEIYNDGTKSPATKQQEIKDLLGDPTQGSTWTDGNILPLAYPTRDKKTIKSDDSDADKKEAAEYNSADYYFLESMNVEFKGTDFATARKDVTVEIKFQLSSLNALTLTIDGDITGQPAGGIEQRVRLHDLVTLSTTQTLGKSFTDLNKDGVKEFSPETSRLRLKMQAKGDYESNLIIDLTMIDYDFSRSGGSGLTTMTINYRGYFESMLNMPENDIFINDDQRVARRAATFKRLKATQDLRVANAGQRENLKKALDSAIKEEYATFKVPGDASNITDKLKNGKLIHSYNTISTFSTSSGAIITSQVRPEIGYQSISDSSEYRSFFFVGDLMYILLDCIFKKDSADHTAAAINMACRYIVAPIDIELADDTVKSINPLCIPIDMQYFNDWFTSRIINKGLKSYRVGIFIRDLIDRLVNNIIGDTCVTRERSPLPRPRIKDTFISTSEKTWYKKDKNGELDVKNMDTFLKRSIYKSETEENTAIAASADLLNDTKLTSKNYCIIYPRYTKAYSGLGQASGGKTTEGNTLKMDPFTPEIFYGKNNKSWNFISNVSLSRTDVPFQREAIMSTTDFGSLSLLANVYDLSFSFADRGANTIMFPGVIFNFILLDFDKEYGDQRNPYTLLEKAKKTPATNKKIYTQAFGNDNPHDEGNIAHVLGFGGYYIVTSVSYTLGQSIQDFEIKINAKFNGSDGKAVAGVAGAKAQRQIPEDTDSTNTDTDGDGIDDETEIENGTPETPNQTTPSLNLEKRLAQFAPKIQSIQGITWEYSSVPSGLKDPESTDTLQNTGIVEYARANNFAWGDAPIKIYAKAFIDGDNLIYSLEYSNQELVLKKYDNLSSKFMTDLQSHDKNLTNGSD